MADYPFKMMLKPWRVGHRQDFAEAAGTAVTLFAQMGFKLRRKLAPFT